MKGGINVSIIVKEIISAGSCGALENFPENTFLIPKKALRDEGTSYHYMMPSRYVDINKYALRAIEKTLKEHSLKYTEVISWSTDGFYRETKEKVLYRKEEGCSVVDSLADIEKYDPRNWGGDSFQLLL